MQLLSVFSEARQLYQREGGTRTSTCKHR